MMSGAVILLAVLAHAQPDRMPSPEVVLEILRAEYRSGPIAEEVTVQVSGDAGRRTGRATIRLNASDPARPRLRLDLTPLEIWCDGPRLVAVSSRNETLAVERLLTGPPSPAVLADLIRPLALPQLELAFSFDDRLASPTPFTPGVRWLRVIEGRYPEIGGSSSLIVLGRWEGGGVKLFVDKDTDRLRGFHAQLGPGPETLELTVDVKPAPIGGAEQWAISTNARELTERLTDLTPRRGPVEVGELCPELTLIRPSGTVWSLTDQLEREERRQQAPHALCLVLHRFHRDEDRLSRNTRLAQAALDALGPGATAPWRIARHAGRIYDLRDYGASLDPHPWDAATHGPLNTDHSPNRSIGWFADDTGAVLVLVGLDRRIVHIANLEDAAMDSPLATRAGIRSAAVDALRRAFPAEPMDPVPTPDQAGREADPPGEPPPDHDR